MQPGCDRNLANASASIAAMQARMKSLGTASISDTCTATRLYFLEVVKARAVTAECKSGPARERELRRFDADVEHTNEAIAARCQLTKIDPSCSTASPKFHGMVQPMLNRFAPNIAPIAQTTGR
jgi:hypothetical protein